MMLKQDILEKLVYFTDEEIDNLNGRNTVDRSIYLSADSHIIDCYKLLEEHQQLGVRKHTRFIEYPMHKHNYIELMYVYGGSMTHIINEQQITIYEGELLLLNQTLSILLNIVMKMILFLILLLSLNF